MSDLIDRQAALDALGEEPPVWYDGDDEIAERNQWRRDKAAIEAVPLACNESKQQATASSDLIDRHDAIDAIRNIRAITGTFDDEILLIDKAEAQTELMMLPSASTELSNNSPKLDNKNGELISRQDAIDAFWKLDVELRPSAIDAVLDMLKSLPSAEKAQLSEEDATFDCISRQAAIDAFEPDHPVDWYTTMIVDVLENLPSAQPERVWTPCDIPPKHHRDVIVRGVEAIGGECVYKVMQWDVDTWRPKNYAPSITWLDWSEI